MDTFPNMDADGWQTAFYTVLSLLTGGIGVLNLLLIKYVIDLGAKVVGLSTVISSIMEKEIADIRKRQHSFEGRITQLEHDNLRAGRHRENSNGSHD